jgi:hypothetical protein
MPTLADGKKVGLIVVAIMAAGLLFKFGKDLPLVSDARDGFGG